MLAVNWPISFQRPEWLWLLLAIPVIVMASLHFLRGIEKTRRYAAIALRCVVVALLAVALARIEWVRRSDHVAVMFVLDRSRSIPDDLQTKARSYIREVTRTANRDDRVGVIGFDGQAEVDVMPSRAGFDIVSFGLSNQPDRTDLAAGLRMAMAAFPSGFSRRIVLLTDGNQNMGDLGEEIRNAAANHVSVDVVPLEYKYTNEVLFDRIVVPTHSGRDTKVPVRMILKSQRPTRVRISLYHNGREVTIADPVLSLSGGMRPDPFTVPMELHEGGVHRLDARVAPLDPADDSIAENNQATAFTFVEAQGRVLVLGNSNTTDDAVMVDALRREKITVEYQTADSIHLDLLKLQEYSAVVLANISAETFNSEQHKALASYVRDFGGGLVMTGGDESFGAGGWIGTPVEEVSPVSFEIKQKRQMPRGALAIVMHSCEAPNGNYWGQKVAESAIETISSLDYIGVIAYSWTHHGANWEVPLQIARDKRKIISTLQKMEIGDMPDFDSTMIIAVRDLMKLKDASQRHMIIISDGDPSPPSRATIKSMQDNKITCSTVGIGYGEHVFAERMEPIARDTGGRYYAVKNPRRLPQIFVKEARVVKRALIDNREFHPVMTTAFDELTPGLTSSQLPPLGGLVLTERKPDALVPIIRHGKDAGSTVEDPVLAHWNYEMGKMAVFTSGLWDRWGQDWSGWGNFGKFWAQVVRWAMADKGAANFDVLTRLDGNRGKVVVEALNKDASYLNYLQIRGKMVPPSGDAKSLYLTQTGPGRYEADFDVDDHGNYLVSLTYTDPDNKAGVVKTGLSVPYSAEFRELGTNFSLLDEVVAKTNGRRLAMDPAKDHVFSRDLSPAIARQPMWRFVVQWLLLPLFLLDVASRRLASTVAMSVYVEVAVFVMVLAALYRPGESFTTVMWALIVAECVGWAVRWRAIGPTIAFFTSGARSLSGVGQRGARSLSQLKDVREKVREDMTRPGEAIADREPAASRTIPLESTTDRKRKFDVGDEQAAKPASDLTESLGGATSADSEQPGRTGRSATGGSLSDRLRKAKQRAQDQMKEKKDEE